MKHTDSGTTESSYIDMRTLASPRVAPGTCPVAGCTAQLGTVSSQWGEMPHCPAHRIRIHANAGTFVYYHGKDRVSKRDATLRNILFETDYFRERILGNQAKAETHRMGHETSEDALTWNVFVRLARTKQLASLVHTLTGLTPNQEPELYLWGLKVALDDPAPPAVFPELVEARDTFEKGINKFLTEPDIMLHCPGQVLLLIEAKFTSGNTLALEDVPEVPADEKPKSREGLLRRYALPESRKSPPPMSGAFHSQLYRNLVFAQHMANKLGVRWGLASLVSEEQCLQRQRKEEYQDPAPFIYSLIHNESRSRFVFYSWEKLYADHVAGNLALNDLAAYMIHKSANGAKAFSI